MSVSPTPNLHTHADSSFSVNQSASAVGKRKPTTFAQMAAFILSFMLSLLVPLPAHAVGEETTTEESSAESTDAAVETTNLPDSFGRDTPRSTMQGFMSALGDDDTLLAANYLNLSKSQNPNNIVRQLKQALDAGGRIDSELAMSNDPEGNVNDRLPPNQDKVGTISLNDMSVNLIVERVDNRRGDQYWQISRETLDAIPAVVVNVEPTLVQRYTFDSLKGKKFLGYDLADMVAVILMTVSCFVMIYIIVWLLYLLLTVVYPHIRKKPLPVDAKVVLPMAAVLTAMFLSEVMVQTGVSVTVREPVNRVIEIVAWFALTWLLLRVIDAVFRRAEEMSYRRNNTERVSILGLLRKLAKAMLLILAGIIIFGNLGFDLTTGIAALGVGGLALALGAQKTIENLVGSVVVVTDQPVRVGDYCKFGTYEGTVLEVGIRSTRVRTLSRTIVTIPNGEFSSLQIENYASRDMFRFWHNLYLKRNASPDTLNTLMRELEVFIAEHYLTNNEWNQVRIAELRQDCYVIELQAYVDANGAAEFYDKQNIILIDVLRQVEKYDVEHALPTQQLLVDEQPNRAAAQAERSQQAAQADQSSEQEKPNQENLKKENPKKEPAPSPKRDHSKNVDESTTAPTGDSGGEDGED